MWLFSEDEIDPEETHKKVIRVRTPSLQLYKKQTIVRGRVELLLEGSASYTKNYSSMAFMIHHSRLGGTLSDIFVLELAKLL